ncbi:hypothetical protein J1C56_02245 [Aminobacter anthyllidis]|uniref:Uncharacterized protein n=1 Tax=Aminobacter anthyllidis TaxID=1035067 RepID=A0A9X1A6T5_9HYPH|nr:hypothetical protein [Aminobacter anthyllidis]MBT1154405.1 hypothetical protein [Aminobacter anthyllidis]
MRSLDPHEEAELVAFAKAEGRLWKAYLNLFWYRGLPVPGFPLLYGLRNTHGPYWLDAYRLPKNPDAVAQASVEGRPA